MNFENICRSTKSRFNLIGLGMLFLVTGASAQTQYKVIVAYTQAVRALHADMLGFINLMVQETNQAYTNSGINARIVLARTVEVDYVEGTIETDLDFITNNNDNVMDNVHLLRTEYSADEVVLLTTNGDFCGLGWVPANDAAHGFVTVSQNCATGYYSFGHEIGHNFGADHDIANGAANPPFVYGHGYQSQDLSWRTIMAYNCSDADGCPRLQYFSNPAVNRPGTNTPMGIAASADVARVHNERVNAIAAFQPIVANLNVGTQPIRANEYGALVASNSVTLAPGFLVESGGQLIIDVAAAGLAKQAKNIDSEKETDFKNRLEPEISSKPRLSKIAKGFELEIVSKNAITVHVERFDFFGKKLGENIFSAMEGGTHTWVIPNLWLNGSCQILRVRDNAGNQISKFINPIENN